MKYGFYDRLTSEFPSQINVDLIEKCNYACIHCPYSELSKEHKISNAKLSFDLNKKLVDEVAKYGASCTQQIRYSGGEPFLHPQILELLDYAVKNSGVMVSVTTNGSIVDSKVSDQLLSMGLGLIDFSLDAFSDQTYREIRVNGDLEKVRNNVLYMLKQKEKCNSRTKIVVSFVKQDKNEDESADFENYWYSQGIDYVVIRKKHSAGGFFHADNAQALSPRPCVYPWERIVLTAKGELAFCPANWEGKMVIHPNYADTSIKDVWTGENYSLLRQEHLKNQFSAYMCCESCPERVITIWPFERTKEWKGYGDMISELSEQV